MIKPIIAPSILAADFANLQKEIEMINGSMADYIHVDVMDGVFVPNISLGLPVAEAINRHAKKPLDVHLMIIHPENYVGRFKEAGADNITVHYEACNHLHRVIDQIKNLECGAGVAINPHTSVDLLAGMVQEVDMVCIMSVNPGYGGQKFIEYTYEKVRRLREMIDKSGSKAKIEIDGGVSMENAATLLEAGADILVAGNFIFSSESPSETIKNLKNMR